MGACRGCWGLSVVDAEVVDLSAQEQPWPLTVLDTPGVMMPAARLAPVDGLKLALTGTHWAGMLATGGLQPVDCGASVLMFCHGLRAGAIKDTILGEVVVADFLLYCLNRLPGPPTYADVFGVPPSDDIDLVLAAIGRKLGCVRPGGGVRLRLFAVATVARLGERVHEHVCVRASGQ